MSRLPFAPKLSEIEITEIKSGIGQFTPKPNTIVSFAALKEALKKAGYTLAAAKITVAGKRARDTNAWQLVAGGSGQRFTLAGDQPEPNLPDAPTEITGDWQTVGTGSAAREVITPRATGKPEPPPRLPDAHPPTRVEQIDFTSSEPLHSSSPATLGAPIRTSSPGLTVYRGGAFTPRYIYTRQRLGALQVDRHLLLLSLSYTPTPTLQLEAELPVTRILYRQGARRGDGTGAGNLTVTGKYRFFRQVEAWGDRQAALRFGLELPTGTKDAPDAEQLPAPEFVRQQLSPINGGLAPHIDVNYSQAKGRFIFGGNIEGVLRAERAGFRTGHELRVNTDLEYVLWPRNYDRPGGEVFAILETNFIRRGAGRIGGARALGSSSTEYYLAPGLQYAAHPRFVLEASLQLPVVRETGPQVLRIERSLLVGARFLY